LTGRKGDFPNGLEIAKSESDVDYDVLIASCLLHDISRDEQFADPRICHATAGGEKAFHFLVENGFSIAFAEKVEHCIQTHRFRKNNEPQSIETKILFDADGAVSDGTNDTVPSFFQEYKYKLENVYSKFYAHKGKELAWKRKDTAVRLYEGPLQEVSEMYESGCNELSKVIDM